MLHHILLNEFFLLGLFDCSLPGELECVLFGTLKNYRLRRWIEDLLNGIRFIVCRMNGESVKGRTSVCCGCLCTNSEGERRVEHSSSARDCRVPSVECRVLDGQNELLLTEQIHTDDRCRNILHANILYLLFSIKQIKVKILKVRKYNR